MILIHVIELVENTFRWWDEEQYQEKHDESLMFSFPESEVETVTGILADNNCYFQGKKTVNDNNHNKCYQSRY